MVILMFPTILFLSIHYFMFGNFFHTLNTHLVAGRIKKIIENNEA